MKCMPSTKAGFTLIEIIVTLTIAAILSVMLVQFMGSSIFRSTEPALSMQEGLTLQSILENMNADYKMLLLTDTTPLATFKTYVENGNDNVTATAAGTPYYGPYTWSTKYVLFDNTQTEAVIPCTAAGCNILKVSLSIGSHSLTTLFAR